MKLSKVVITTVYTLKKLYTNSIHFLGIEN